MKTFAFLSCILLTLPAVLNCEAQVMSPDTSGVNTAPYGLTIKEWQRLQKTWSLKSNPVTLYLEDGRSLKGQLLLKGDSTVTFWMDPSGFVMPDFDESKIIIINMGLVDSVLAEYGFERRLIKSGLFWGTTSGIAASTALFFIGGGWVSPVIVIAPVLLGAGAGELIDMSKRKRGNILPYDGYIIDLTSEKVKNNYVLFPTGLHFENKSEVLSNEAPLQTLKDMTFDDLSASSYQVRDVFGYPVLNTSWQAGLVFTEYNNHEASISSGFTVGIRPSRRLFVEYNHFFIGSLEEDYYSNFDNSLGMSYNENIVFGSNTLFIKYVPIASDRLLSNRFELTTGIGLSLNKLQFSTFVNNTYQSTYLLAGNNCAQYTAGLALISGMDFYLFRFMSAGFSVSKTFTQAARPDPLSAESQITHEMVTFEGREADPSSLSLFFSLRIHLF